MKKYKNILFDLDGTLIDPKEGITNSVKYALRYFGIEVGRTETLYKFIGPSLRESFSKYYSFNGSDTELAVSKYREYYKDRGVFQNAIYDGVPDMLRELQKNGKTLCLATLKPEVFAKQILENLKIDGYFSFVCGSTLDKSRDTKALNIMHVMSSLNLSPNETVMIGDRSHDVVGAKEAGIDSVGVLYGYGDYDELKNAGATYIAKDIKELLEIFV